MPTVLPPVFSRLLALARLRAALLRGGLRAQTARTQPSALQQVPGMRGSGAAAWGGTLCWALLASSQPLHAQPAPVSEPVPNAAPTTHAAPASYTAPAAVPTAAASEATEAIEATSAPEQATEQSTVSDDARAASGLASGPSFAIRIQAPNDIRSLVNRFLDLKRYQQVPDLDNAELLRLLELSETQIRSLLATQGYFTPQIDQTLRADATANAGVPQVDITIDPGPRTHIRELDLQVQGAASSYAPAQAQLAQLRQNWSLPTGAPFTQEAWSRAKAQALQTLQAERFATAKLAHSQASIDPDSSSAQLQVLYESGPVFRYGPVQVQGAQRYDAAIAQRLTRLPQGRSYRQSDLLRAQQRLLNSGYYAGASVIIDTVENVDPQAAPVRVNVQELPLQKLVLGVGFNTDSGPGVSLEHTHNRVPALGWRALTRLKWNRKDQIFSTSLIAPPDEKLWQWLLNASYQREQFGNTRQTTQQVRAGRTKNDGTIERTAYLQYDRSKADYGQDVVRDARAFSANYVWTLRQFNSHTFPTGGFGLSVEGGGGFTFQPERRPFVRVAARYLGILSLDNDLGTGLRLANPAGKQARAAVREADDTALENSNGATRNGAAATEAMAQVLTPRKNGELLLRLQTAALRTRDNAVIPPNLLFLAGGNASVRGYGYQQIGIKNAKGGTEPGRYLMVGSLEYRRPVWRQGRATDWDSIVFLDAGSVANHPAGLRHLKYGVGAGAIWRSPVGPVELAAAYGVQDRKLRLHMNLGFTF